MKVIELAKETYESIHNIAVKQLSVSESATLVQHIETLKENERKKKERWDKKHGVVHLTPEEFREYLYREKGIPIGETEEMSDELKKRKEHLDIHLEAEEAGKRVYVSLIEQYSNKIFSFYVMNNLGVYSNFYFIPQEVQEMRKGISIIFGAAVFEFNMMMQHIKIDFKKKEVYYLPKKSEKYPLTVDNRIKDVWESFCNGLLSAAHENEIRFKNLPR